MLARRDGKGNGEDVIVTDTRDVIAIVRERT